MLEMLFMMLPPFLSVEMTLLKPVLIKPPEALLKLSAKNKIDRYAVANSTQTD